MCATVIQELNNCIHISKLRLNKKQTLKPYQKSTGYQDMIQGKALFKVGFFLID